MSMMSPLKNKLSVADQVKGVPSKADTQKLFQRGPSKVQDDKEHPSVMRSIKDSRIENLERKIQAMQECTNENNELKKKLRQKDCEITGLKTDARRYQEELEKAMQTVEEIKRSRKL